VKVDIIVKIENNKIIFTENDKKQIKNMIKKCEGKEVHFVLDTNTNTRSTRQNAFFHGVILPAFSKTLGLLGHPQAWDLEYIKEVILKKPFLTVNQGTKYEYVRGTSTLSVGEFWEFLNFCIALLINIGGGLNERESAEFISIADDFGIEITVDEYSLKK